MSRVHLRIQMQGGGTFMSLWALVCTLEMIRQGGAQIRGILRFGTLEE
jgi:hypothetical protein